MVRVTAKGIQAATAFYDAVTRVSRGVTWEANRIDDPNMNRICWWCVEIVSRMLEPGERDAVRGDFAESGETGGQALRGLLGLVLRRQTALWRNWRPWLALVGAVAPLGILLSLVSRRMAQSTAITSWLYLNNWDWTYVRNTGFRLDFAHDVAIVLFGFLLLSCWSWTSGFVLGYLSRRAIWINGALFCLVLVTVELLGMPLFLGVRCSCPGRTTFRQTPRCLRVRSIAKCSR